MGKKKMSKEERKKYEAEKAETLRVEMEKERFVNNIIFNILHIQNQIIIKYIQILFVQTRNQLFDRLNCRFDINTDSFLN